MGLTSWVRCPESRIVHFRDKGTPRITSWVIFSRPCGTGSTLESLPRTKRPGLLSAVPAGLNLESVVLRHTLKTGH
jgi:hypothetical protein